MIGAPVVSTCALFGAGSYTTSWLGLNYLVILAGFTIIAFVYMLSKFMPASVRGKLSGITRTEIIELFVSAVIVLILLSFSATACGISSLIGNSITTVNGMSPLQFSDFYIGNLTFNTGLTLLTHMYSLSIGYAVDADIMAYVSGAIGSYLPSSLLLKFGPVQVIPTYGFDLSAFYGIISDLMLDVFAPLIIIALGMLFVQWLAIPLIQYTAFIIVLPVAITMRAIAYSGSSGGLRQAANSVLAIAVAAYIVYPLMVSFNPCIVGWVNGTGACGLPKTNPAVQYMPSYTLSSITPGEFTSISSSSTIYGQPGLSLFFSGVSSTGIPGFNFLQVFGQLTGTINVMAQFFFQAIMLFALNVGVTIAFAMGLSRALAAGLGGQSSLWSSL
jgi:hypothetical protein